MRYLDNLVNFVGGLNTKIALIMAGVTACVGFGYWALTNNAALDKIIEPPANVVPISKEYILEMPLGGVNTNSTYRKKAGTSRKSELKLNLWVGNNEKTLTLEMKTFEKQKKSKKQSDPRIPLDSLYEEINERTRAFIITPNRVILSDIEEQGCYAPKFDWLEKVPFEKNTPVQIMFAGGDIIIKSTLSNNSFPFVKKHYEKFIKNAEDKYKKRLEEITQENFGKNYVAWEILNQIAKSKPSGLEVVRRAKINLDLGGLNGDIPMGLFFNYFVGRETDPNKPYNPGFGNTQDIICFSMNNDRPTKSIETNEKRNRKNLRKVAFLAENEGIPCDPEVFLVNSDGKEIRQIYKDAINKTPLIWSPDGRYLVFNASVASLCIEDIPNKKKYFLNIRGGHFRKSFCWSSDSKSILVGTESNSLENWFVETGNLKGINFKDDYGNVRDTRYPIGIKDKIFFLRTHYIQKKDELVTNLYSVDKTGSNLTELNKNLPYFSSLSWIEKEERILLTEEYMDKADRYLDKDKTELYLINPKNGHRKKIKKERLRKIAEEELISPEGMQIILEEEGLKSGYVLKIKDGRKIIKIEENVSSAKWQPKIPSF